MSTLQKRTVTLSEALDPDQLAQHLENKFVRRMTHPVLPLAIYNYTAKAQYAQSWDAVLRACRGLITQLSSVNASFSHEETLLGRPWAKFHNFEEHDPDSLPHNAAVTVTDKLDGSLGIGVKYQDSVLIATRGSFTSDQALHATRVLESRYPHFNPNPEWTYLWEIIYPQNRIVVNYHDFDDLTLLGAVHTASGEDIPLTQAAKTWPGPVVDVFTYRNLMEALEAPDREGREGLVVQFHDTNLRVKLKQEDYIAIHRVVTDLNERRVWEVLSEHGTPDIILEVVPDELYPWVREVSNRLLTEHSNMTEQLKQDARAANEMVEAVGMVSGTSEYRKKLAATISEHPDRGLIFALTDGHDISAKVWEKLRPEAISPFADSETE